MTGNIIDSCSMLDMVGILSSGGIMKGFSNSLGQFNWHENQSFNFDWSMYTKSGKAIKQNYSEARLVQMLEKKGIGRPSTFSSLIDKIQQRQYVKKMDEIFGT